jgi:hypothetical protein
LIGIWGNVDTLDKIKNNNKVPEKERNELDKKPDYIYLRLNRFEKVDQPFTWEGQDRALILTK